MERAFSYFIIPFNREEENVRAFSIPQSWKRVERSRNCELHSYITDRMFGRTDAVCEIYDIEREEAFCDNRTGKSLTILFTRLFLYKKGVSFGVFCLQYGEDFTIDDVIFTNSRLKYLSTVNPQEFTEKPVSPDSFKRSQECCDNLLAVKLKELMKDTYGEIGLATEKALMCVYGVCPDEGMNKQTLFYLATGNNKNFAYSEDIAFSTYTQSENVMHGLCREGIAVITRESGGRFVKDKSASYGLVWNYRENYLLMYIILLCQYYGFKDYNQKTFTLYSSKMKKGSWRMRRKMEQLSAEADMFYLQNVYSDISQITHQNRIYEMLYEIYSINALINDFKEDISICNRLLEQEKLNSKMLVIILSTSVAAIAGLMEILANFTSVFDFLFS